ncbi:MAG: acyl-CoA thioesterase [Candidatus Marinimicrobia bacterium]|nr:acyl-CoA thioesterase [Candidatus Neomarinimicrobiota bacterium]
MIKFNHKVRILYRDIDYMGVVYYSRYFEYFEAARNEMLRSIDLPYTEFEKRENAMPVVESYCKYREGARYDDVLIVSSKVKEFSRSRIKIEYTIRRQNSDAIIADGYTIHAFINAKGRASKPPTYFLKALEKSWKDYE